VALSYYVMYESGNTRDPNRIVAVHSQNSRRPAPNPPDLSVSGIRAADAAAIFSEPGVYVFTPPAPGKGYVISRTRGFEVDEIDGIS